MLLIKSKEIPKWLSYVIINTLILCLFICISGFKNIYSSQIKSTNNNKSILSETDTVYIDDDFNSSTPGWGIYCFDTIQHGITAVDTGGLVFVFKGVYYENILISKQIKLFGEDSDSTIINGSGSNFVLTINADSVKISNFYISNSGGSGIKVYTDYNTLQNINSTLNIKLNSANYNTILSNHFCAVSLDYSSNNFLTGNSILYSGGIGIYLDHSSNNNFSDNNISNHSYDGFYIAAYCTNNEIINNIINNNGNGIEYYFWSEGDYNIISGNTIQNNQQDGIHMDFCKNNIVSENTLSNNGNYGISIDHSSNLLISNNTIEDSWNSGILIVSHSHYNQVLNNEIKFNNLQGIEYNSIGNNNLISGNVISNNQQYGISITSEFFGGNNVFSGNVIESNFNHGIYCYNSCNHSVISGNTIALNYGNGIHITESSNFNVISGNLINSHFMGNGIYVESGSDNNYFTYNNLINNVINVTDEAVNMWYNGYPSGGNYFDDYIGEDNFSGANQNIPGPDGIGDTPYIIPGGNNQDQYPYVVEWSLAYPYPLPDTIFIDDDFDENTIGWGVDHFTSINWGVNSVAVNGIVSVANGLYNEHLYVSKMNQLIGEGMDSTIIDGNGERNVIYTFSDSVKINDFKIQNCGSSDESAGIYIGGWYTTSNLITDNNLVNNNGYGLIIHWSSDNNKIYHNNFINNTFGNATNEDMGYMHYWDNGYSTPFNPLFDGGNFWDDYLGEDNFSGPDQNIPGSDGIGDTPYIIEVGGYYQGEDNYPLTTLWSQFPVTPQIVYVDDDYNENIAGYNYNRFDTIQNGINAVSSNGTVHVNQGIYYENVLLNKKIDLIGQNMDSTIIDGYGNGDVIILTADSMFVSGFTIQNSGDSLSNAGLSIASSNNFIINNKIINNLGYGVFVNYSASNNIIHHNLILNNYQNAFDEGSNIWSDGYPSGGNYWEDYVGNDAYVGPNQNIPGEDFIGDVPYYISGGNNLDQYPLMNQNINSALLPAIVYVDDDFNENYIGWHYNYFDNIQDGIEATKTGGVIHVYNGLYNENVNIHKSIRINGNNKDSVIINGEGIGKVVLISSPGVIFSGFTIINSGNTTYDAGVNIYSDSCIVMDNNILNNNNGIYIYSSNGSKISQNFIANNNAFGIRSYANSLTQISENIIINNNGDGLFAYSSGNNCISNNTVSYNNENGIVLRYNSHNSKVKGNIISFNSNNGIINRSSDNNTYIENEIFNNGDNGVFTMWSSDCEIKLNNILLNDEKGVKLTSSNGFAVFHNCFENNLGGNAFDENSNTWHNSYSTPFDPSGDGGNFWTDYFGLDNFQGPNQDIIGSDGIGDTFYNIPGGSNIDQYPFMEPNGWNIFVDVKVFLEGVYNPNEIKPILNSDGLLPLAHPYNKDPWNYHGYEGVTNIPTPDIVDWILVELRDTTLAELATSETTVDRRSAFLLSDGSVVDLDGYSNLLINYTVQHNLFVVIKHRNHLSIMSADPLIEMNGVYSYDFTISDSQAYLSNQKELNPGVWGMIAGDADASGLIDETDKIDLWLNEAGLRGYFQSDMNLDSQVNNLDKNDFWLPNLGLGTQVPE